MNTLDKINKLVEQAKDFPNAIIEYSFDLPEVDGITPDNFFGVKALYNQQVAPDTGAIITYKLI